MKIVHIMCIAFVCLIGGAVADFSSLNNWPFCPFPIQNQLDCGSCFSFASSEVTSDRICIATNGNFASEISPEYILDCSSAWAGANPCDGGYIPSALQFLAQSQYQPTCSGVSNSLNSPSCWSGCYPYTAGYCQEGGGGQCPAFQCPSPFTCTDGSTPFSYNQLTYASVAADYQSIQQEIATNGPVATGFAVCQSWMNFWSQNGGQMVVYNGEDCNEYSSDYVGGHAVKIVGWQNIGGTDAWIVANSWSTAWGYNGFFFMPLGVNSCGIEADVSTVLAGSQMGASGTSTATQISQGPQAVTVQTKNGPVQDTRNRVYGTPVTLSVQSQMVQQLVQQFLHTLNNGGSQHTLQQVTSANSKVVAGVRVKLQLTTVDQTRDIVFSHSAEMLIRPNSTVEVVRYHSVPVGFSVGLSKGMIAGIVIGCIIFALLVFALIYCLRQRCTRKGLRNTQQPLLNEFTVVDALARAAL